MESHSRLLFAVSTRRSNRQGSSPKPADVRGVKPGDRVLLLRSEVGVNKPGTFAEARRREFYERPAARRKRKEAKRRKR